MLLLLTWSHNKQQQISNKSEVTVQRWFMRTAGSITHGCMNNYSYKAHRDTARWYTHATEQRNDSCLCEAGADELLRGCRDKGNRAQLRCVITHAHSQRHAVPRIRQARRRLSAFKMNMKQEIWTESPWPPCWLWRQLQWTSAGAASGWDAWGVRVWDARMYI